MAGRLHFIYLSEARGGGGQTGPPARKISKAGNNHGNLTPGRPISAAFGQNGQAVGRHHQIEVAVEAFKFLAVAQAATAVNVGVAV